MYRLTLGKPAAFISGVSPPCVDQNFICGIRQIAGGWTVDDLP